MGSCQSGSSEPIRVETSRSKPAPENDRKAQEKESDDMYRTFKKEQDRLQAQNEPKKEKDEPKKEEIEPKKEEGQQVAANGEVQQTIAKGAEAQPKPVAAGGNKMSEEQKKMSRDLELSRGTRRGLYTRQCETMSKYTEQMKELDDLMKMAKEIEDKIKQTMLSKGLKVPDKAALTVMDKAMHGDVDLACPPPAKVVRIFTSSTFTDTKNERNMLMKHAYPKVKEHCRKIGYEFQVVDMRWGVRDEATDDHMTTELCLKELKLCQEVSTGPNFISLLSHKYGYINFPRVIEATEYENLMGGMEDEEAKQLFERWYTRDQNAVPPAYVLSPISSKLPDFLSHDQSKKKTAKETWWAENEKMQSALGVTASKVFDTETARKYVMSVTETEVQEGLLNSQDPSKHSLWLKRNIEDIEQQPSSYLLSRFIECTGTDEKWKKSRSLLNELKNERMAKKLSPDKILNYTVQWNQASGISPEEEQKHKEYLDTMCTDFVHSMTQMIDTSVAEKDRTDDVLTIESQQHIRFCQDKCKGFHGRQDTLDLIKQYVQGTSNEPLVLHGTSGTGKTSIMAMAAKMMKQWTSKSPVLVLRFLGTSPYSSSLFSLLETVTQQINHVYKLTSKSNIPGANLYVKILQFKSALLKGRPEKPLIILLDSLDQLDPAYDARKLAWLPNKLNPGTKVIVSTLPEPQYDCFPELKNKIKTESNFIDVPSLSKGDAQFILNGWLADRQRSLTEDQMNTVITAFNKCPTPLFLKLSFEEAATWTSYMPQETTVLQDTVRASIDFLFQKLEKVHGKMLISRALGYLTIANNGATEAELEDLLSCDDDVLNDVYMYWTPPIRRLPPLLLVRVRTDLNQYLVERGADGVRVIYWYHRQFIEAAEARYCSDEATNKLIHERLADFFNGTWAGGRKKPFTTAKGEYGEEDRLVSHQPLKFGAKTFNLRTLNNLPYHRVHAGQVQLLKEQCLTNPNFLIHKLLAVPLYKVLDDYQMAKKAFPKDKTIQEVLQALLLSQKGLNTDPRQIVPQLLLRLNETEDTKDILQECRNFPETYLLPTKCVLEKPGGQLVHSISAHKSDIDMIDLSDSGKYAVTVCQSNKEVTLWNVEEAKELREVKGLGQCTSVYFCNHDEWIACEIDKQILVQDMVTGRIIRRIPTTPRASESSFCTAGKGKTYIMSFVKQVCVLTNLLSNPEEKTMPFLHPEKMKFGAMSVPRGSNNFVAVCDDDQYFITVYDLKEKKFRPKFRGFPRVPVEDDPGEFEQNEVEAMAILPDETALAYTTMFTSEVIFADFDGNHLRKIPADEERSFRSLSFTPDSKHMYILDDKLLYFFDTTTLQEVGVLDNKRGMTGVQTHDTVHVLTVGEDGNLRIWDRSRSEQTENQSTSTNQSGGSSVINIKDDLIHSNSRYAVLVGTIEKNGELLRMEIVDVFKDRVVRYLDLPDLGRRNIKIHPTPDPNHVLLRVGYNHLFRVDVTSMTLVKKYVGFITELAMASETKDILCSTRGGMNVKLYDKQGDFSQIIKCGQKQRITRVHINSIGTVGVAVTDEGPLLLYDLTAGKHMYSIETEPYGMCCAMHVHINKAGTRLIFSSDGKIPGDAAIQDIEHLVLWDIQNKKELKRMYDGAVQKKYKAIKDCDVDIAVDDVFELTEDTIITGHYDYIMRVWDINNGALLHRLVGHKSSTKIEVMPAAPYIFSYGSLEEEDCFRIWDKEKFICNASFTLDQTINTILWSKDGKFLISFQNGSAGMVTWQIHHGKVTFNETDYPESFTEQEFPPVSVQVLEKKQLQEEGDPDTDPEEESDDDDDDDDDDDA